MDIKKVGTHNGTFHADDVIAYVILDELYGPLELIRSRDKEILATCDLVFDVGGGKYDHHTTDKEYRENNIPYAAAGLVWRDFGKQLLQKKGVASAYVDKIFTYIDEKYIQGLDAVDNGVRFKREMIVPELSTDIHRFNPKWNLQEDEQEQFRRAVEFGRTSFMNLIKDQISKVAAIHVIEKAYAERTKKEILFLEQHCPWHSALLQVDTRGEVLFVIYKDHRKGYLIQVVPLNENTFEARKDLPEEWAGKEEAELNQIIGIDDAIFAHPARFIAGAKSKESILKMAELALK
ncbi:MYG1 family protein [Bacillus suaedaesalsae]|uniref:MYG1 family protein n=1 Tax=Bacillus suaedaesalsae TaxID=2810349 RepID=A0ABS2DLY1_9BACI|nr:MYG1 family protein [Bacillus suaedaesalsae]MBM6619469.1 MYG1 family protein [Bacillus suaedaesalsae]